MYFNFNILILIRGKNKAQVIKIVISKKFLHLTYD